MLILLFCVVLSVVCAAPVPIDNHSVKILQYENQPIDSENSYKFHYELSDGQRRTEEGQYLPSLFDQNKKSLFVSGSYEFVAPDGYVYSVYYTADETGFHPSQVSPAPISGVSFAAISPNAIASLVG